MIVKLIRDFIMILLSQTKQKNRSCEFLLHDIEAASVLALLSNQQGAASFAYPSSELDRMWKLLLLNQFHDVLPGSSIGLVYKDALTYYAGRLLDICDFIKIPFPIK